MLLLLIILGFWGVLVFWVGVCLGARLIGVEISMVVGIFVGEIWGVRWGWLGEWKMAQRVGIGGVGCGRAWVISLPKFFLGNSFHFWKLPPLFCINSRDNVYYHVFLTGNSFHFFIEKW